MNKYQRLVMVAALMNALVMVLFPPFTSQPLARGMLPGFEGFYPLITQLGNKPFRQRGAAKRRRTSPPLRNGYEITSRFYLLTCIDR
ncbi:hypothetical protein, partial [Propionivibrio sp.]|uniref:hypothetical protein n=1 Tax=Propionivibrio sp. TaxID=2212460 RepID=UPI003BF1D914